MIVLALLRRPTAAPAAEIAWPASRMVARVAVFATLLASTARACKVFLYPSDDDTCHLGNGATVTAEIDEYEWCDRACEGGVSERDTLERGDCGTDPKWLKFLATKVVAVHPEFAPDIAGFRQVGGENVSCRWTPNTQNYVDHYYTERYTYSSRFECEARCRPDGGCHAYEWSSAAAVNWNCEIWTVGPVYASLPHMATQFAGYSCYSKDLYGGPTAARIEDCPAGFGLVGVLVMAGCVIVMLAAVVFCHYNTRKRGETAIVQTPQ
eukprot:COSAG05_NODE_4773_length_1377_cov_13.194836_1_plen_265_part_10